MGDFLQVVFSAVVASHDGRTLAASPPWTGQRARFATQHTPISFHVFGKRLHVYNIAYVLITRISPQFKYIENTSLTNTYVW